MGSSEADQQEAPEAFDRRSGAAIWIGLIVAGAGTAVLVGWGWNIAGLKSVLPGFVTMKANAAVGFVLAGLLLALSGSGSGGRRRQLARMCAGAMALLGFLTLCEYVARVNLGIDQLLFEEAPGALGTLSPNRMAPLAALNFILLGAAVILSGRQRTLATAQRMLLLTGLLSVLPLLGYLYGAPLLNGVGHYIQMALHTAVLFVLAAAGAFMLHPPDGLMRPATRRTMGGLLLRRMMPFVIAVPLALGWFRAWGERQGYFEGPLGVAMMMVVIVLLLTILVWWAAGTLTRIDKQRRNTEEELRKALQSLGQLSQVVEQTPASVVITDTAGAIEYVNPAFCRLTGYTRGEALGKNPRILKSGLMPEETYAGMWRELLAGREWRGELQNRAKDGELFWELSVLSPLRDADGRTTHYIAVKENITARKTIEDEFRRAARIDKLTGLPNRALLCDRLQQAVLRGQRMKERWFAVLFLDMDRFKLINDSLGHEVGDLMLKEIARRLQIVVRAGDSVARQHTTARLGGDEFVVLLEDLSRPKDATVVARRLLETLAQPYRLGEHEFYSTASIGIVTSDAATQNAEQLLRDADTAMYEAKHAGRGQYAIFGAPMRQRVQKRLTLENDLRRALDSGQLSLSYQPIVCLQTGELERLEALLRWRHPERGWIAPAEFIPIAEETGLILPIGEWVLREACGQFARWRKSLGDRAPPGISVNVSRTQFLLRDLPERIKAVLKQTGVPAGCLHLEVTESAVMRNAAAAIGTLRAIKAIGVKLDIDDFGTGYSSLSCLHKFPMDVLKIDRSFIANMERGRDFAALVQAVTQLAGNLNIQVVAEGVETAEQLLLLQALDCAYGQGYLFGRPMPGAEAGQFRTGPQAWPAKAGAMELPAS